MRVAAHGLAVTALPGWEVAITRRPSIAGERAHPVLHAATVALPPGRGDYGAGVVEALGADDVFVALLDFGPDHAGTALFAEPAMPLLTPDVFRPKAMQRVIAGQAGVQRFFSSQGRAFCLYAVIGAYARRAYLSPRVNGVVGSLEIAP